MLGGAGRKMGGGGGKAAWVVWDVAPQGGIGRCEVAVEEDDAHARRAELSDAAEIKDALEGWAEEVSNGQAAGNNGIGAGNAGR